jgi:hypothetical protein
MIKVAAGIFVKRSGDFGMDDTGRVIQALPAAAGATRAPHWTDPSPEFLFRQQAAKVKAEMAAQAASAAKGGWARRAAASAKAFLSRKKG